MRNLYLFTNSILLLCFQLGPLPAGAQKKVLTEAQMLSGAPNKVERELPQFVDWTDDGHFLIRKKAAAGDSLQTFLVDCKTGKESVASSGLLLKTGPVIPNVYIKANDLYLKEPGGGEERLTNNPEPEENPELSPDKRFVAFTRKNNLYTIELSTKIEAPLTTDGGDGILNGYASWLYYEEILGRRSHHRSFWWSPDSKSISFMRMDERQVPVFPLYNADGQHGSLENTRYPAPGDPNPQVRIGIVSPGGGNIVWADFNEKDDQYFGIPVWNPDGQALWVQWMNRGQDNLKIYEVNIRDGQKREVYDEKQKAWIDLDEPARIKFLSGGKAFILKSDRDGWENFYYYQADGTLRNQITVGNFWGSDIEYIDEKKQVLYFSSRKENSTRKDFYKVNLDGKNLQRLSFGEYTHDVRLSPGGSWFVTTYSNASTPEKMVLVDSKGRVVRELGDSKGEDFDNTILAKTELIRIKSDDGKFDLPFRITWPQDFDPAKKYPVMISIYGGPNAGTVRDGWYFNGQQQWWAKEGLIQVTMDHRGSGHFGKEGMNYMHRRLGYWEITDWITIVKWLREHGADSTRIGISGFSYGGFTTCYALTYGAGYFTHGIAGGSVTDWQLYDTHYTERYMDTPAENPDGYRESAVLTHTSKYKGLLRIYHGTMDDNVHMQNSIQLIKKLEEQKSHFEFMLYPGGRHGWRGVLWTHALNENASFIYKYLLKKEMPAVMWK